MEKSVYHFRQIKVFIISLLFSLTTIVHGANDTGRHRPRVEAVEISGIEIGFSITRPPEKAEMNALVSRMLRSVTAGRLILRLLKKSFEKYGSTNDQKIILEVFNLIQHILMHHILDINKELKERVMALQLLKEFNLTSDNLNLLRIMSKNTQEHRKLRRIAKRIIKHHSKSSRRENTLT